jgi:hypothetical protein
VDLVSLKETKDEVVLYSHLVLTFPSLNTINSCSLNSPPFEGGVDLVSLKETKDEVVIYCNLFFDPSVFKHF